MITREATKGVFQELLNTGQMQQAIDHEWGDYVYISVSVFNTGHISNIVSCDYNEYTEKKANDDGDLFISKDEAMDLLTYYELDIEQEY